MPKKKSEVNSIKFPSWNLGKSKKKKNSFNGHWRVISMRHTTASVLSLKKGRGSCNLMLVTQIRNASKLYSDKGSGSHTYLIHITQPAANSLKMQRTEYLEI